jgi:hypothetical protein
MALPVTNTTCDIYHNPNLPPAAPDVAGVKCFLKPKGASTLTTVNYTHVLLVGPNVDIRDDRGTASFTLGAVSDTVWIPDKNGTRFEVVLVRRQGRGTPLDHKEVLLERRHIGSGEPTNWPTDNV